jgi:acetyl esterase
MATKTAGIATEDFDYLHHGDRALKLRLFRPAGEGPHPVIVDIHGGAWCIGDLTTCEDRDVMLAENGYAAAAIDFRQAEDRYPSSLADINYAVRWVKKNAADLGLDASRVASCGQSSGGHLALLAAMKPGDPRYAEIPLGGGPGESAGIDATVKCVGMLWPVINPLSRYRHALAARASDDPPGWVGDLPERHDTYWVDEETMREGNPVTILEAGEKVLTPPAIWVQGRPDPVHDYRDPDYAGDLNEPERLAALYRAAGGDCDVAYIAQEGRGGPSSVEPLLPFFAKHLG